MIRISTHVLDNSQGRPASEVDVRLEFKTSTGWEVRSHGSTDAYGRIDNLLAKETLVKGVYRMTFDTGSYFHLYGREIFYPEIVIVFEVVHPEEHYHIPLLLNPYGYTTYRGV